LGCGGGGISQYARSIGNVKKLNDGLLLYAGDYDDFAPGPTWMDGIAPYVNDPSAFNSPAQGEVGGGYALNSAIAGLSIHVPSPESTISIFDSTNIGHNAVAPITSLPSPPRYGTKNTIAYIDGHVQDYQESYPPPPSLYSQSRTRLQQVAGAALLYSSDYDDFAPLQDQWMDELTPYVSAQWIFRSPSVELQNPSAYGYAMNVDIAGAYLPGLASPATMISFFDSVQTGRNATAATTTMPQPPRYGNKNTIAFADGHVAP
jgi:prepilin-type processing-associated H-X9-DG protein